MLRLKQITLVATALGMLLLTSMSFAQRSVEDVYKECGIGGAFFGQSSPTLAFISNVTWDLGTTAAISDSTGGCTIGNNETAAIFIHETFEQLEQDIAQGSGDYYHSMLSLLSCESSNVQDVMTTVRSGFSDVVGSEQYQTMNKMEKSNELYQIVSPMIATASQNVCSV